LQLSNNQILPHPACYIVQVLTAWNVHTIRSGLSTLFPLPIQGGGLELGVRAEEYNMKCKNKRPNQRLI